MLGDLQSPPWLWVPNWSPWIYSQNMRIILMMCLYSNYKWFFIEVNFRYGELKCIIWGALINACTHEMNTQIKIWKSFHHLCPFPSELPFWGNHCFDLYHLTNYNLSNIHTNTFWIIWITATEYYAQFMHTIKLTSGSNIANISELIKKRKV